MSEKKLEKNAPETEVSETGSEPKRESMLQRTARASRESAPEMLEGSIREGRRGAKVGRKIGSVIPGVGTTGGAALGAALYGGREQARIGRDTGDPLYAFMTAQATGGVTGGVINARKAMKVRDEREAQAQAQRLGTGPQPNGKEVPMNVDFDLGDDDATPAQREEMTAKRKRRQRHLGRDRVAESAATEQEQESASPASVATVLPAAAVMATGDAKDGGTKGDGSKSSEAKNGSKSTKQPGFGPTVKGNETAVDAFAKGFVGGMGHAGKQAYLGRRLETNQRSQTKGKGLPHPEQVAETFGYDKGEKAIWAHSGVAGMKGPSGADEVVADRVAHSQEHEAQPAPTKSKRPTYTPSIPIESSVDGPEQEMGA